LISMHIRVIRCIRRRRRKILIQGLSRDIHEGSNEFGAGRAVVAEGALVDLPIAVQFGRVEDRLCCWQVAWIRRLLLRDVGSARPVADFTRDTRYEAASIIKVGLRIAGERLDEGRMTLDAASVCATLEVCRAVLVARAVDPLMTLCPVAHGKLKELIA